MRRGGQVLIRSARRRVAGDNLDRLRVRDKANQGPWRHGSERARSTGTVRNAHHRLATVGLLCNRGGYTHTHTPGNCPPPPARARVACRERSWELDALRQMP